MIINNRVCLQLLQIYLTKDCRAELLIQWMSARCLRLTIKLRLDGNGSNARVVAEGWIPRVPRDVVCMAIEFCASIIL